MGAPRRRLLLGPPPPQDGPRGVRRLPPRSLCPTFGCENPIPAIPKIVTGSKRVASRGRHHRRRGLFSSPARGSEPRPADPFSSLAGICTAKVRLIRNGDEEGYPAGLGALLDTLVDERPPVGGVSPELGFRHDLCHGAGILPPLQAQVADQQPRAFQPRRPSSRGRLPAPEDCRHR